MGATIELRNKETAALVKTRKHKRGGKRSQRHVANVAKYGA